MNQRESILMDNFQEYYEFGIDAFKRKKFNCATTLFFKAIAALLDLFILKSEGIVPSSHANRFRILEEKYPDLYKIADRDFPFYQDSYTNKMDEESANLLKEDVERIKEILKI